MGGWEEGSLVAGDYSLDFNGGPITVITYLACQSIFHPRITTEKVFLFGMVVVLFVLSLPKAITRVLPMEKQGLRRRRRHFRVRKR